jgi:hypothetical protein
VRLDQVERKRVVPAATGVCVVKTVVRRTSRARSRRSHPARTDRDALQDDERGVSFVEVIDGRRTTHRLEHPHAADAEDDLLLDARLAIAAVEACRQLAIPRRVLLEIRVEQVQRDAARAARARPRRARCDCRAARP